MYHSPVKKMACCIKSSFFQENDDCVIYLPLFLLFAACGSVEDSAAPSSSGRFLHINFCNYKSVISENIHPPRPLQEGFFFCLNPPQNLPSPSSSFSSDVPLKNFPVLIFWKPTILFALLPEIGGGKIIFKCYKSCKTFQLLNIKKITNLPLSRCHYFFSFYLTKYTCYSVLLISNGGSETMIPFLHSLWL